MLKEILRKSDYIIGMRILKAFGYSPAGIRAEYDGNDGFQEIESWRNPDTEISDIAYVRDYIGDEENMRIVSECWC